jgi:hypothetical protein
MDYRECSSTHTTEVHTMMNIVRAAMILGILSVCGPSLAADVYRCDSSMDRRTVYQGSQCEIGVKQRAIDPRNAKRERIRLEQEQKRRQQKSEAEATAG